MSEEGASELRCSRFRFRRQICGTPIDVTVGLTGRTAKEFSVVVDPHLSESSHVAAVIAGVRAARDAVAPDVALTVTVVAVEDHSHATSELGHKICGEGAAYRLLGHPEKAPFEGFGDS